MKRKLTKEEMRLANLQLGHAERGVANLIALDEYYKIHIRHSAAIADKSFMDLACKYALDFHTEGVLAAYKDYAKDLVNWYNKNRLAKIDETGAKYEAERIKIERQSDYWSKMFDELKDQLENGVVIKDGKTKKSNRID